MDADKLSYYPFLTQAVQYIAGMGTPLDDILSLRSFNITRYRGRSRVMQAIQGEIQHDDTINTTSELFSYPIARILVSCIDDPFLTRRYAFAEAKFAYKIMEQDQSEVLEEIGQNFGVTVRLSESGFIIHFADYIRAASRMRDLKWKLVNRRLNSGYVNITKEEYARLLQEAVRAHILAALPLNVPDEFCHALSEYINEIKSSLDIFKGEFDEAGFGEVEPEHFPPCIVYLLSSAQGGINLAHSARFALTSFLLNIGMSVDQVINLFNVSPDFNEEKTRYQVEHIAGAAGTFYKPPSCNTMITYGNCHGRDEKCKTISHPLSYYIQKKSIKSKSINSSG
jgi:DNA primase large subunit